MNNHCNGVFVDCRQSAALKMFLIDRFAVVGNFEIEAFVLRMELFFNVGNFSKLRLINTEET